MIEAFVLISQAPNTTTLEEIKKIPEVIQIYPVYGVYDLVVMIRTESMSELNNVVNYGIRRGEGINSTLTMIVIQ